MKHLVFSIIFCVIFFKILFLSAGLFARDNSKSQNLFPSSYDYKQIDINNVSAWITNYGSFFRHPTTGNSGFEWPKGGGVHAIYCAGLWVGALVEGEPRVAIAEYSYEYSPGTIDAKTHLPNDPADPRFRVYKIQKGIMSSWDYQNWPLQDGAPANEVGEPLTIGDQTLWMVYNDADTNAHVRMGSLPLGIEVQQTVFGDYQNYPSFDFIFMRFLIINKSMNYLDSTYLSLWIDPDLGNSGDDFVGCDSVLSLGFCYNSTDYDSKYGEHPPAVGLQILEGPLFESPGDSGIFAGRKIPGFGNFGMTSFVRYYPANFYFGDPQNAQEVWQYMQALWRNGQHITYGDMGDHPDSAETNYMFSGDPESATGWLDKNPSNRYFMMNTGPFNLTPGDSTEMVATAIIARGTSNLNSVTELKRIASTLQTAYETDIYKQLRSYKKPQPIIGLKLFQNYPNPFNSSTTLAYQLPINRVVKLEIFNIRSQRVATIVNERQEPNTYTYTWDASGLASGVYFASLKVAQYQLTKKLLLIK